MTALADPTVAASSAVFVLAVAGSVALFAVLIDWIGARVGE